MLRPRSLLLACAIASVIGGCSGDGKLGLSTRDGLTASGSAGGEFIARGAHADPKGSGDPRCNSTLPQHIAREMDTNGDGTLNLRKVYRVLGTGATTHSTLICREADVNHDGLKDVVRLYDDDGKSLREDVDRNFDGIMDLAVIFQKGVVVTKEYDDDYDGKIDRKTFFDNGKPIRTERDLLGHSTPGAWRPSQWQYYEDGVVVRMGTDLDGDSKIDRWDRDQTMDKTVAEGEEGSGKKSEGEGDDGEADADEEKAEG